MRQGVGRLATIGGAGLFAIWGLACSLQKDRSSTASDANRQSLVESLADSIEQATAQSASATASTEGKIAASTPTRPLPRPKKEPWMDTLVDLTDIPPPNTAVLLEEDPLPQNKHTVEILIAKQYRPKQPVQLTLRMYVTEAGKVRRFQILKSSDPNLTLPYLAYPILELQFAPALYNGKPVAAWTTLTFQIQPEK